MNALARNVPRLLNETGTPGLQLSLAVGNRPIRTFAAGIADTRTAMAVTASTRFRVASLGKPIAAAVTLRAVEAGLIDLDRPLGDVLGGIASLADHPAELLNQITVRALLAHASGVADQNMPHVCTEHPPVSVREALAGAAGPLGVPRLDREPGYKTRYSGLNYALLELSLEEVLGTPFPALAERLLFAPMRLGCTFAGTSDEALGCGHHVGGEAIETQRTIALASSGLVASTAEVAHMMQRLQQDAAGQPGGVLRTDLAALMFRLHRVRNPISTFSLGIHRVRGFEPMTLDHHGHRPGLRALLNVIPARQVVFAAIANSDRGEEVFQPALAMVREIAGARREK